MRGARKKYVYIRIGEGRFVRARVMIRGEGEASVSPSMDAERIVIVGKPVRNPPYGYKVIDKEELPKEVLDKLSKF